MMLAGRGRVFKYMGFIALVFRREGLGSTRVYLCLLLFVEALIGVIWSLSKLLGFVEDQSPCASWSETNFRVMAGMWLLATEVQMALLLNLVLRFVFRRVSINIKQINIVLSEAD